MKKKDLKGFLAVALTIALVAATPFTALAGGVDKGRFTDWETLTWTTWDGVSTTYGRGPIFSDLHPDITDPEYYLKEAVYYPGENRAGGMAKGNYPDEVVEELRKFVNSFDWIHSDELTRAMMVHDRIGNGCHGNVYASAENINGFPLLVKGKGQCGDFSGEFMRLARFVGLECETYDPSYMHQACLVKISGQWFATDPTGAEREGLFLSNVVTHPVDYETEVNRYAKELEEKWSAYYVANPDNLVTIIDLTTQKTSEGTITEEDWARINPMETELSRKLADKEILYEEYERQMIDLLKSMW